jgi:fructosamine-3-kinase
MLPADVREALETALGTAVVNAKPVYGGDINQTARVTIQGGDRVFIKWNRRAVNGFFAAEAHGLRVLAQAGAIRVPEVLAFGDDPAFLAMEWVEPGARGQVGPEFEERLGHELATLHNMTAALHGLDQDNYIGSLPQPNAEHTSWVTFFSEQRIGAQMQIARQKGKLPAAREANLRRLQEWLPIFLDDEAIKPSLLHGDLWGGNYMLATNGDPVLIDPATYYGHREVDLAMTELFGGGYAARVDAIVQHYIG